ncbi:origin recognition complex subunit 2 [Xylariomycetidae sp. FL2044]|nr:origin recognition complex subunit 2 [Xylariomycetidae sp. FL2044]
MVRTKQAQARATGPAARSSPRKRSRDDEDELTEVTPSKRRNSRLTPASRPNGLTKTHHSAYDFPSDDEAETEADPSMTESPSKRKSASVATTPRQIAGSQTPRGRKGSGYKLKTPSKPATPFNGETPRWKRNDRSARKKSARALIERVVGGDVSDEDPDQDIAEEIYNSSEEEEGEDGLDATTAELEEEEEDGEPPEAATPSKKPRGRTKTTKKPASAAAAKKKRKKSPTPPRDLPPHELYFAQNRPGRAKTSNNTLASLALLTHDEYFSVLRAYADPHAEDVAFLESIHAQSFPQWAFELSQGFSVCLYGYGSKRALLHKFAKYIYEQQSTLTSSPEEEEEVEVGEEHHSHKIVIINGYVRTLTLREILTTIASALDPAHKLPSGNATAMLDSLRTLLNGSPSSSSSVSPSEVPLDDDDATATITLLVNSIDAAPLRRPGVQATLAQLASHPRVRLACTAGAPDFALLWDSGLRSSFDFVFHDCTSFAPPGPGELEVVDDVHELLGRRARRVGGKEGVGYVLRSLPENAKNLFRLLVGEVLVLMMTDGDGGGGGDEGGEKPGVEYRMLYNKAVEEFICSSEMAFRTLLKEFHDHQMITSRKDVLGTELLSVPFRKEELEAILEDLMS